MIAELIKNTAKIEVKVGPRGRQGEAGASTWNDITGKPTSFTPSAHAASHAANGSDPLTLAQSQVTGLTSALAAKADLIDGMVPTGQIPAIAITEFLGTVANQAAMLALTGQRGDWCNRSDVSKAFVLAAEPASTLGNWAAIDYPAAPVLSVNGQAGTVVLGKADIGLGNVANSLQLIASNNLSDLVSAETARTNLGLGSLATQSGTLSDYATVANPTFTGVVHLGSVSGSGGPYLLSQIDIGIAVSAAVYTLGQGFYSELRGVGSQAFHAHIGPGSSGGHTAFDADLTGGTGANYGLGVLSKTGDYVIYHRDNNGGDPQDRFTINEQGGLTWYKNGTTLTTGSDKTSLVVATPNGTGVITLPAGRTGTLITTGDTGTVTSDMLAGSIAPSKITGTAAVLGANTFTGAQTINESAEGTLHRVQVSGSDRLTLVTSSTAANLTWGHPTYFTFETNSSSFICKYAGTERCRLIFAENAYNVVAQAGTTGNNGLYVRNSNLSAGYIGADIRLNSTVGTFTVEPRARDASGGYTGIGHTMLVKGGEGQSSSTGASGGVLNLTGGSAGGSGNNASGGVNITAGAPTGSGARGGINVASNASDLLGFYGVTAVTRQVLATGAGRTVDDVITFLQLIGLVKQS